MGRRAGPDCLCAGTGATVLSFDQDIKACADLVRQGDPERFRCVMAAPVETRPILFTLYAANIEISRAPWVSAEAMIAEMRLQWWRDVGQEIATGAAVRRYFVTTPLARFATPEMGQAIDDMAAARRWDIYRDAHGDEAALFRYIDCTAGSLMWMGAAALGAVEQGPVRDYAFAAGLAAYLKAIPELEARKRVPLLDGRAEAVSTLAGQGLARLSKARSQRHLVPKAARPALLPGFEAEGLLRLAVKYPSRVVNGSLQLGPVRRHFLFSRQALTGHW